RPPLSPPTSYLTYHLFNNQTRPPTPTLFPYTTLFRSYHTESLRPRRERSTSRSLAQRRPPGTRLLPRVLIAGPQCKPVVVGECPDRKSTRLNSSHQIISYAVFCLKKKTKDSETREDDE